MVVRIQEIQERVEVWWTLAALLVAEQIGDLVTTAGFLRAGGSEHNALGARLLHLGDWPLLVGVKPLLALALAAVLVALVFAPAVRRSWFGTLALLAAALVVAVYALILGWNGATWLILTHALPWR